MGDVVNLRQARKKKARVEKEARAETNRVKFGRTKKQKALETFEKKHAERELSGKELDTSDNPE